MRATDSPNIQTPLSLFFGYNSRYRGRVRIFASQGLRDRSSTFLDNGFTQKEDVFDFRVTMLPKMR